MTLEITRVLDLFVVDRHDRDRIVWEGEVTDLGVVYQMHACAAYRELRKRLNLKQVLRIILERIAQGQREGNIARRWYWHTEY